MTKEEQRFTAAVAAMNGLLANNSFIFNMNNDDKPDCDNLLSYAIDYADALIDKLMEDENKIPFANSKNGDGKKTHDVIVADTVVTKANPDARVFTKNQILNHRIK